jgi:hypothetical protein
VFNLFDSGLGAVKQAGLLIGGLICAGLGVLLVGNAVYRRFHAIRVEGRVIGARQSGNTWRTVYRYTLPTGQSYEGTSNQDSGSIRGKETGSIVPLLVIPENPTEVVEARIHTFTVIGVLMFAPAGWLFYTAVAGWPIGGMTWVVAAVLLFIFALRIYKAVQSTDKRLPPSDLKSMWRARSSADATQNPVRSIEDIVSQPTLGAREETQRAGNARLAPFLTVWGSGLLVLSVYLGFTLAQLEVLGLRAPGVVNSLELRRDSKGASYYPSVKFKTKDGHMIRFRDRVGSNAPSITVGDTVTVLYLPSAPGAAVIDHGARNLLPSMVAFLLGLILSVAGVRLRRSSSP